MEPKISTIRRWKRWMGKINFRITDLYHLIKIKDQLDSIIFSNTAFSIESELWNYFPRAITLELIVKISKICGKQDGKVLSELFKNDALTERKRAVISLMGLLQEFSNYHSYFTRRRYVDRSIQPKFPKLEPLQKGVVSVVWNPALDKYFDFSNRTEQFDKIAGKSNDILSKKNIDKDIKDLEKAYNKIKIFRDKVLAHETITIKLRKSLKTKELEVCLRQITAIAKKYSLLLLHSSFMYNETHPEITEPFLVPWVKAEDLDKLGTEFKNIQTHYDDCVRNNH